MPEAVSEALARGPVVGNARKLRLAGVGLPGFLGGSVASLGHLTSK